MPAPAAAANASDTTAIPVPAKPGGLPGIKPAIAAPAPGAPKPAIPAAAPLAKPAVPAAVPAPPVAKAPVPAKSPAPAPLSAPAPMPLPSAGEPEGKGPVVLAAIAAVVSLLTAAYSALAWLDLIPF